MAPSSSETASASGIRAKVDDLNQQILDGEILSAFEQYYADDVVMSEVGGEPRVGKEANREYEEAFVEGIKEFRGAEVRGVAVNEEEGRAYIEWFMDFDHEQWGDDTQLEQIAAQRWEDGQIVEETFYHA
jgi:sirohydrochlorin ferrochelatase